MTKAELGSGSFSVRGEGDAATRLLRAGGRAVDLGLLSAMTRPSRMPDLRDCARVHREIEQAHALYAADGADALSFHEKPPALTPAFTPRSRWGTAYEELAFESEFAIDVRDVVRERWLSHGANRRAQAAVLRHPRGDRPWLICLHGLGTGWPLEDFAAFRVNHLHRELGLNLVLPVMPLHGPRRDPDVPLGALGSFELLETFHGIRQAVWDTRRLMAWARSQGAARIGLYGMSVGAYVGALVAGLENVEVVIAGIPLCDVPDLLNHHASVGPDLVDTLLEQPLRALFRLISPLEITPTAALEKRAIYAGSDNLVTTCEQAERLWRHWGRPGMHWYAGGHVSFFWSPSVPAFVSSRLREAEFVMPGS